MAAVTVVMSGDDARLKAAHDRLLAEQQKLLDKYAKLATESKKAGETGVQATDKLSRAAKETLEQFGKAGLAIDKAFGDGTAKKLGGVTHALENIRAKTHEVTGIDFTAHTTAIAAVTAGVSLLRDAWNATYQAERHAIEEMQASQDADRSLAQIATSAQDFQNMQRQAAELSVKGGISQRDAKELLFDARSNNFEAALPAIIASSQVVNPKDTAKLAIKLPSQFPGVSAEQAASAALVTTSVSDLNYGEVARALPTLGEGGVQLGATLDESLAALGELSSFFKGAETTADRVKMFASKAAAEPALKGLGLVGSVEKVMGMSEEDRSKFLGDSVELGAGYKALSLKIESIKSQAAAIRKDMEATAAGGGAMRQKIGFVSADPAQTAMLQKRQAEAALRAAETQLFGEQAARADAASAMIREKTLGDIRTRTVANGITVPFVGQVPGTADVIGGATRVGASPEAAGALGTLATDVLSGRSFLGIPFSAVQDAASMLTKAASTNMEAAKLSKEAAAKMNTPASNSAAARAQAAGVNQ